MNILIAPNAFKGSLTAQQAAKIIAKAFSEVIPTAITELWPVADGGDGTASLLAQHWEAKPETLQVFNPLGEEIAAPIYVTSNNTAIIELADAAGIRLIETTRLNPLYSSTFGVGQLITRALDKGCKKVILGLGGSATNDMGVGLLKALGVQFFDDKQNPTDHILSIKSFDCSTVDPRILDCEFIVPCDVNNPLVGKNGAAYVFGPQKGATPAMVSQLEKAHVNFANLIAKKFDIKVHDMQYAGAAGGTAAALFAFCGAKLVQGSDYFLNIINFNQKAENADLIITGEGKIDDQSSSGKAPYAVAISAKKMNKPVIAFGGSIPKQQIELPYQAVFSICNEPISLKYALENADKLLYHQAIQVAQAIKLGAIFKSLHNKK